MPDEYRAYGCILHFPQHRLADMHGLVRAIVYSRNRTEARACLVDCLHRAGVRPNTVSLLAERCQFLDESQSHIEREVLRDTRDAIYLCSVAVMYLNMSCYQPMRYKLPRLALRLAKRASGAP
jgi:alpha-N-acetylglucosamine transferase